MPTTKLKNGQLPDTISSKTVDNTNTINTTTTNLKITGGTNGQVLSTDGSGNLSWKSDSVSDGDKGDITVASSGATWTVDNDAVTYAKIQNVSAASRLLGRGSASGSGDVQEISLGTGLTMSGTTLSASSGGVSDGDKGDITVSSSGSVWTIDNGVVTYAKLQDVSASSRLLGRATAGAGDAEEITIGSGLSLSGTTLSVSNSPIAVITKTSDETVTSSTTIQNDDELTWNGFTSGKNYWVEINILASRVNTSATQGFRYGFSGNSNGYLSRSSSSQIVLCDGTANEPIQTLTNAGVPMVHKIFIALKTTGNFTGTFKFAQQLSNATGITVHAGSRMTIWEVA